MRKHVALLCIVVMTGLIGPGEAVRADSGTGEPTAADQYMIELTNRTRLDPVGEAERFGIDLNEGLAPGTISPEPREPLAVDFLVTKAARCHNDDILANMPDLPPTHAGSDGRSPTQRVADAGANFVGGVAENNSWAGGKADEKTINRLHALLFKEFTNTFEVPGRGHRKNLLTKTRDLTGIAVSSGQLGNKGKVGLCTQDYITRNATYITGVCYADKNKNGAYNMGEGFGGVTVKATRLSDGVVFMGTSWGAGGYNVEVEAGTYTVEASGGGLATPVVVEGVVVEGGINEKVDFVPQGAVEPPPPPPDPVFDIKKATTKLGKTGVWAFSMKKGAFSHGAHTFTTAQLDALTMVLNGVEFFTKADRDAATVKEKLNKAGEVVKLVVKDAAKNKLVIDLNKRIWKAVLKQAPDLSGAELVVRFRLGDVQVGDITTAVTFPKKPTKGVVTPATGEVTDLEDE